MTTTMIKQSPLLIFVVFVVLGCASTHNNRPISGGQFLATYSDKQVGADGTSVVNKVMQIAETQCGPGKVEVISLGNTGIAIGTFPHATLIYRCK